MPWPHRWHEERGGSFPGPTPPVCRVMVASDSRHTVRCRRRLCHASHETPDDALLRVTVENSGTPSSTSSCSSSGNMPVRDYSGKGSHHEVHQPYATQALPSISAVRLGRRVAVVPATGVGGDAPAGLSAGRDHSASHRPVTIRRSRKPLPPPEMVTKFAFLAATTSSGWSSPTACN